MMRWLRRRRALLAELRTTEAVVAALLAENARLRLGRAGGYTRDEVNDMRARCGLRRWDMEAWAKFLADEPAQQRSRLRRIGLAS